MKSVLKQIKRPLFVNGQKVNVPDLELDYLGKNVKVCIKRTRRCIKLK